MSATLGIGNSARCELTKPSLEKALWAAASRVESSPTAVAMMHSRGCSPAPARSAANRYDGPGRRFVGSGPSAWNPMLWRRSSVGERPRQAARTSGLTMCNGRAPAIRRHRSSAMVRVWLASVS